MIGHRRGPGEVKVGELVCGLKIDVDHERAVGSEHVEEGLDDGLGASADRAHRGVDHDEVAGTEAEGDERLGVHRGLHEGMSAV